MQDLFQITPKIVSVHAMVNPTFILTDDSTILSNDIEQLYFTNLQITFCKT